MKMWFPPPINRNKRNEPLKYIVIHRAESFNDTQYHAVIYESGLVQRFADWETKQSHVFRMNRSCVGIAVFGNFATNERSYHSEPTPAQVDACVGLINEIVAEYPGVKVCSHSHLGTEGTSFKEKLIKGHDCPGDRGELMKQLRERLPQMEVLDEIPKKNAKRP
jgi:hypothetical protein